MQVVQMKLYGGKFLTGRAEGEAAFNAIERDLFQKHPEEIFLFDFTDVKVLAPSFCDEVFGELGVKYSKRFFIDEEIDEAHRMAFSVVEDSRKIKFQFSKR